MVTITYCIDSVIIPDYRAVESAPHDHNDIIIICYIYQ